jgi:hypothetical protein
MKTTYWLYEKKIILFDFIFVIEIAYMSTYMIGAYA